MILFLLYCLLVYSRLNDGKSLELDSQCSNIPIKDIPTQSIFVINIINDDSTNHKQIVKTSGRSRGLNACDEVTFVQKDNTKPKFVFKRYNSNDGTSSSSHSFQNNIWVSYENDPLIFSLS